MEPRLLVREALESLIKNYSYRVVCSIGSAADIDNATAPDDPKLVILGGESIDHAIAEAVSVRKRWPGSKIVALFEHATIADFQRLLTSDVDGCVPLFASPETLIRTLDLVKIEDARVVVMASMRSPTVWPSSTSKVRPPPGANGEVSSGHAEHHANPVNVVSLSAKSTITGYSPAQSNGPEDRVQAAGSPLSGPKLSEREAQILDGLVQGHANKVIARTCDITEATVKVHMKSILRKIQVANRTQAAVWALEHGHSVHQVKDAC
ncbi:response regulator transcription factor [Bradyrhizobium ivorense]|nr:response regulator transcription factor [Bradyrhizobium ivorense]